jgi:hypothetical protein
MPAEGPRLGFSVVPESRGQIETHPADLTGSDDAALSRYDEQSRVDRPAEGGGWRSGLRALLRRYVFGTRIT